MLSQVLKQAGPDTRINAMAPMPGGVESAQMVSLE
jgi:hypothetical protein